MKAKELRVYETAKLFRQDLKKFDPHDVKT